MLYQYDNLATSSFLLWLDHEIIERGQAYTNYGTKLYRMPPNINGYVTYATPFSQLVSDTSIAGANVLTGLYLNNVFVTPGTSGFVGFNHSKGQAYFSTGLANSITVSGNYAIKDINITMPNIPDISVLFETKMGVRNKISANPNNSTGIGNSELTYPAIFCRNVGGENLPMAMGGIDETITEIELYIFADSQFLLDGVKSIIKDRRHDLIPLISANRMPFNNIGIFKNNIPYNYDTMTSGIVAGGSGILVKEVVVTDFNRRGLFQEAQSLTQDCYFAVADIKLSLPRLT
jgi:hypothetical protein